MFINVLKLVLWSPALAKFYRHAFQNDADIGFVTAVKARRFEGGLNLPIFGKAAYFWLQNKS